MTSALDKAILDAGGRDALAEKLDVHPNTIRYWERGQLSLKRARQLGEITGRPWHEFVSRPSDAGTP